MKKLPSRLFDRAYFWFIFNFSSVSLTGKPLKCQRERTDQSLSARRLTPNANKINGFRKFTTLQNTIWLVQGGYPRREFCLITFLNQYPTKSDGLSFYISNFFWQLEICQKIKRYPSAFLNISYKTITRLIWFGTLIVRCSEK